MNTNGGNQRALGDSGRAGSPHGRLVKREGGAPHPGPLPIRWGEGEAPVGNSSLVTQTKQQWGWPSPPEREGRRAAFTLVELLVAVALAGLWVMMLLPALARTQPSTKTLQCQANLKRLTAAWVMYANDYRSTLVWNNFAGAAAGGVDNTNWVTGWLDWTTSRDNTNTAFVAQESYAKLAPYFNSNPKLFKCPADSYKSQPFLWSRVRSISMNAAVGQGAGKTSYLPTLFVATKLSSFVNPTPAGAWVLADEQADSINDGCLINDIGASPGAYSWLDLPASYHNGGGSLSFADGHTEIKKWLDPRTRVPVRLGDYVPVNCPGSVDYAWLVAHTPRRP